jgi:hypothetical protein
MLLAWCPTAQHSLPACPARPQMMHVTSTAAATACLVSVEERAVGPVGEKVVLLL